MLARAILHILCPDSAAANQYFERVVVKIGQCIPRLTNAAASACRFNILSTAGRFARSSQQAMLSLQVLRFVMKAVMVLISFIVFKYHLLLFISMYNNFLACPDLSAVEGDTSNMIKCCWVADNFTFVVHFEIFFGLFLLCHHGAC